MKLSKILEIITKLSHRPIVLTTKRHSHDASRVFNKKSHWLTSDPSWYTDKSQIFYSHDEKRLVQRLRRKFDCYISAIDGPIILCESSVRRWLSSSNVRTSFSAAVFAKKKKKKKRKKKKGKSRDKGNGKSISFDRGVKNGKARRWNSKRETRGCRRSRWPNSVAERRQIL